MKRFFSKTQKLTLAKFANWKCQICGTQLDSSFHADHIIPFSKGGSTDVCNGQALCASCNLSKGNYMRKKITPREWQKTAIKVVRRRIKKDNFETLIQATPGGGKTIFGLLAWEEIKQKYGYTHLLVIVPSDLLRKHWIQDAHAFNISMSNEIIFKNQDKFSQFDGIVTTYATIHNQSSDFRMFCKEHRVYVIADEVHHISTKEGSKWGVSFKEAVTPAKNLLMLTGTPWTTSGDPIPWTESRSDGYVKTHYSYSKMDAIRDNVCRDSLIFPQKDVANMHDDETGEIFKDFKDYTDKTGKDGYMQAVTNKVNMLSMFRKANEELNALRSSGNSNAGGLIVAPSIDVAHKFATAIEGVTGVKPIVVSSRDNEDKMDNSNSKKIDKFKDSHDRWIISVNMISEGIDIKRLQVLIFMSNAKTELYFRQVLGRVERRMNNLEVDKTCYIFYISHPKLDEWVAKINDENSQGVKLREDQSINNNDEFNTGNGDSNRIEKESSNLIVLMEEVQTYMIQNGMSVNDNIVAEIEKILLKNPLYSKLPNGILVLMAEANIEGRESSVTTNSNGLSITEQEAILRSQITTEVNRQIRAIGATAIPKIYSITHSTLNKLVGMSSNEDAGVEKLQSKLDLAEESNKWKNIVLQRVA